MKSGSLAIRLALAFLLCSTSVIWGQVTTATLYGSKHSAECLRFIGEYTARHSYAYSATNQLQGFRTLGAR